MTLPFLIGGTAAARSGSFNAAAAVPAHLAWFESTTFELLVTTSRGAMPVRLRWMPTAVPGIDGWLMFFIENL